MRWLLLNRYRRIFLSWLVCGFVVCSFQGLYQYGYMPNLIPIMKGLQSLFNELLGGNKNIPISMAQKEWQLYASAWMTYNLLYASMTVGTFAIIGWLSRRLDPEGNVMRCRKCKHILSGITEPRCPECGEQI